MAPPSFSVFVLCLCLQRGHRWFRPGQESIILPWSGVWFKGGHVTELEQIWHKGTFTRVSTCHFHHRDKNLAQTVQFTFTIHPPPPQRLVQRWRHETGRVNESFLWRQCHNNGRETFYFHWGLLTQRYGLRALLPILPTTWRKPALRRVRKVERGKLPGWHLNP